jgi:hypothetical protein
MKKFLIAFVICIMLLTPVFSGLNKHGYTIFEEWIYANYNNEGVWVTCDLGAYVSNKQSLIRVSIQVTNFDTDGSEYVYFKIKEYNSNYKTNIQTAVQYNEGTKAELLCWTDDDGIIEYKIEYPQPEYKKVLIKLILENSIN